MTLRREFRDEPRSRRRAYLACIATYHLRDYLKRAGEPDVSETMHLLGRDASYDVVQSICNVAKHCGHDPGRPHRVPFEPGQDYERPPGAFDVGVFDRSCFDDSAGGREILVNSEGLDIYDCVRAVLGSYTVHFAHHLGAVDLSVC